MSDEVRPPWEFESPLCAEVGTHLFFPKDPDDPQLSAMVEADYTYARKVCNECEHKTECALWAIEKNEKFGMWGGLSPRDRVNIRKQKDHARRRNLGITPI